MRLPALYYHKYEYYMKLCDYLILDIIYFRKEDLGVLFKIFKEYGEKLDLPYPYCHKITIDTACHESQKLA